MGTPVERKFFKISQLFFIVITSLSLLGAVGCFIYGVSLHGATANEKLTQPTPTYDTMKAAKAQEKAALERQKELLAAQASKNPGRIAPVNPEAIPPEYLDLLNSIEKSLVSFAHKANQISPSDKLRFKIFKTAERYAGLFATNSLLSQLDVEAKALEADSERIKNLSTTDPDYISWGFFLDNFFSQIDANILQQRKRIEKERIEAANKKMRSNIVLYGAAASFGIFIFFTMFLVVLSMERNTYILRQIQENLENNK